MRNPHLSVPLSGLMAFLLACKPAEEPRPPGTVDEDIDGFTADLDCDDADADVNPDAPEVPYDGIDNDCSAVTPDDDLDGDGALVADDCDDERADVYPNAVEYCDGIDHDCDLWIDEPDSIDAADWFRDQDSDGFGDPYQFEHGCTGQFGSILTGGDCDDSTALLDRADLDGDGLDTCAGDCDDDNAEIFPGAIEACNDVDDDCYGGIDDGLEQVLWYLDADLDGYGDPTTGLLSCPDLSPTRVTDGTDCDDGNAGLEHDDADGDGVDTCGQDCDDANAALAPGAPDPLGDGVDTNCDGADGVPPMVWCAERYTGEVWVIDRALATSSVGWSGLGDMIGIARSPEGRIWVSRYGAQTVAELHPDGTFTDVFMGLSLPHALNFDPIAGTLLLANYGIDEVLELNPADGTRTVLRSGFADPISAVRLLSSGEVWVAQRASPEVMVIDDLGGVRVGATMPTSGVDTLTISDGLLYAGGQYSSIYEIDPLLGTVTSWADLSGSGVTTAQVALDPGGPGLVAAAEPQGAVFAVDGPAAPILLNPFGSHPWQCVGNAPVDADGDGFYGLRVGGDDCADEDAAIYPGAGC